MKNLLALLVLWSCLAVHYVLADVSDEKVRMWVSSALEGKSSVSDEDAKKKLNKIRNYKSVLASWNLLKECRDAGQSLDLDLASAEHYLFIRAFAGEKGELDIEALPGLYGNLKEGLGPVAQLLRTSDQPVSPVDADVVRWGNMGVAAGLNDYKTLTSRNPHVKTGKFSQYKLALEGYYVNYARTIKDPECKVTP